MTLRKGMSPVALSREIRTMLEEFRPDIAQIAANSLRWDFGIRNGFPYGNEMANEDHRWCAHVREEPNGEVVLTHFGATPDEAVDKAMASEQEWKARKEGT